MSEKPAFDIPAMERRALLSIARESILSSLEGRSAKHETPRGAMLEHRGAFVTLHTGASLRGCIGRMSSPLPLHETVFAMARAAAFEDPRFPPLALVEYPRVRLEISVLSPMEPIRPEDVRLGVHGLFLTFHGRSGVFLPQVPTEQGWDLDEYLEHLCFKAGLPEGSWKASGAELSGFTACVFGE